MIRLEGRVVSFDVPADDRRVYGVKFGYDGRFQHLAPGLMLQHGEMERCCELGLDPLELLGDDKPCKRRFSTAQRQHYNLRAYAGQPLPLGRSGYRPHLRRILEQAYRSRPATARRRVHPRATMVM